MFWNPLNVIEDMIPPPKINPLSTLSKMAGEHEQKAALAEECEEAAMEQGLQGYPQVLSALAQAGQHFCQC